jgi:hypothetical protein
MEIKILLLLLLAHYILFFLFRGKGDVLACGIFGWSGSRTTRFNKQKFDILGLFNNSRGGDSCGVSTDGEIYYGTLLNKSYDDFVVNKNYLSPVRIPVVIGHSRKASVGAVSETNAHPFGFGDLGEGHAFIGCHNGTLSNYEELGKKYEVETSVYSERNMFLRTKVDSEILLEILYKTKDTEVLQEYIGGAALLFQNLEEPNTLFAFHGASKKEVGDRGETLYEERPLYYYQEAKDSVYISSIEEALIFIGGEKDKTVFEFDHNLLYKIKDGNVDKAVTYEVDRRGAGQKKPYGGAGFCMGGTATGTNTARNHGPAKRGKRKERSKSRRFKQIANVANIYDETVIEGDFKSAIYYNKLRYWRNGHLIDGVFTYIKGFGLYKIGDQASDSNNKLYQLMGEHFSLEDGMFLDTVYLEQRLALDETIFVPFEFSTKEPPVFFFHNGIMLETMHDFAALNGEYASKFSFEHLSQMSKYPICRMRKNRPDNNRQEILYNGQPYTNNFIPLQCNNCYNIENGNLINIDRLEEIVVKEAEICCSVKIPSTNEVIQLPMEFDAPIMGPNSLINAYHPARPTVEFLDEDPPIEDYFQKKGDDEKVLSIINKHIMPVYTQLQTCNEDLKNEEDETIQELIDLNKDYLLSVDCIVESKSKENEGEAS